MEPYTEEQRASSETEHFGLPSSAHCCQLPTHWVWSQQVHPPTDALSASDVQEKLVGHVIGDSEGRHVHVSARSEMEGKMMMTYWHRH